MNVPGRVEAVAEEVKKIIGEAIELVSRSRGFFVTTAQRCAPMTQVIPPLPSLFTLLRPYLAHFFPVFSRFLCVFTAWPRRFHRAPSRNPGPRNSWQGDQEGRTPPFVRHARR